MENIPVGTFSMFMTINERIKRYICKRNTIMTMLDLIRNIIAFVATFAAIMAVTMCVAHLCISACVGKMALTHRQENLSLWIGGALAVGLIPFYYFPC